MPAIGSALVGTPIVFAVTIIVSLVTSEPPLETKQMVRQCHSPDPMPRDKTAADIVAEKNRDGNAPADD